MGFFFRQCRVYCAQNHLFQTGLWNSRANAWETYPKHISFVPLEFGREILLRTTMDHHGPPTTGPVVSARLRRCRRHSSAFPSRSGGEGIKVHHNCQNWHDYFPVLSLAFRTCPVFCDFHGLRFEWRPSPSASPGIATSVVLGLRLPCIPYSAWIPFCLGEFLTLMGVFLCERNRQFDVICP